MKLNKNKNKITNKCLNMFKIGFNYVLTYVLNMYFCTTCSYLQTLITRAAEHFRSSPWSYNIAIFMPHLLKGMNLYIVEFSYIVFNENVIRILTFFEIFLRLFFENFEKQYLNHLSRRSKQVF